MMQTQAMVVEGLRNRLNELNVVLKEAALEGLVCRVHRTIKTTTKGTPWEEVGVQIYEAVPAEYNPGKGDRSGSHANNASTVGAGVTAKRKSNRSA